MVVTVTQIPDLGSRQAISDGLRTFNRLHMGNYECVALDVYVRDPEGVVVGGLIGETALGWLSVHGFWIAEGLRGTGIGTRVLRAAESAAIERGCRAVILDTLSFQAPAFYEKRGYVSIGVVENYRGGAQRLFMQKVLVG